MTSVHIHHNGTIFPEPLKFKPERWLEKRPPGTSPLDRYLVSFSKGSRQCVGMKYVCLCRPFRIHADNSAAWRKQSCTLPLQLYSVDLIIRSYLRLRDWMLILNMICLFRSQIIGVKASRCYSNNLVDIFPSFYIVKHPQQHFCLAPCSKITSVVLFNHSSTNTTQHDATMNVIYDFLKQNSNPARCLVLFTHLISTKSS